MKNLAQNQRDPKKELERLIKEYRSIESIEKPHPRTSQKRTEIFQRLKVIVSDLSGVIHINDAAVLAAVECLLSDDQQKVTEPLAENGPPQALPAKETPSGNDKPGDVVTASSPVEEEAAPASARAQKKAMPSLEQMCREGVRAGKSQNALYREIKHSGHPDIEGNPMFIDRGGGKELASQEFVMLWVRFDKEFNPDYHKRAVSMDAELGGHAQTTKASKIRGSSATQDGEIGRGKVTEDQIRRWLGWVDVAELPPDTWLGIGMALHHHFDGGNTGLRLWQELSHRSDRHKQETVEQQYRGFNSTARGAMRMVYELAVSSLVTSLNLQLAWRKDSSNSAAYQLVDEQVITVSLKKLTDEYRNRPFPQLTAKGAIVEANPIDIWQANPKRRDVYGICAEDSRETFIERAPGSFWLNIFPGLAKPGEPGKCGRFKQFIFEVICDGRQWVYDWVWKWMAWIVQNPTKPPLSAIMLNGRQGTGKNLFYSYLAKAIGEKLCYLTQNSEELFAKHNHLLQGRRLCCADEAYFDGDPRQRNEMKGKITGDSITVNPKGVSQYVVPNMAAWLLLSNSEKSPDNSDDSRRITYITPSDKYIPTRDEKTSHAYYTPIYEERDGEGPASLLRELLDADLTGFKPYPKLSTPEGKIAAKHGDLGDAEWFRDAVETGEFPIRVTRRADGLYMVHQTEAKDYAIRFQKSRGKRSNDQSAGLVLQKLGWERGGKSNKFRIVPPLVEVRKAWIEKIARLPDFLDNPDWEKDEWEFQAEMGAPDTKFEDAILSTTYRTALHTMKTT